MIDVTSITSLLASLRYHESFRTDRLIRGADPKWIA